MDIQQTAANYGTLIDVIINGKNWLFVTPAITDESIVILAALEATVEQQLDYDMITLVPMDYFLYMYLKDYLPIIHITHAARITPVRDRRNGKRNSLLPYHRR